MESFMIGWCVSAGWFIVLVPIFIVKGCFRVSFE